MQPQPNYVLGDRRAGCACAYVYLEVPNSPLQTPAPAPPAQDALRNVDILITSTGRRSQRFFCQQTLTNAYPAAIEQAPAYSRRSLRGTAKSLGNLVTQAFFSVCRFLFPRIQTAVGIQLWRWQP